MTIEMYNHCVLCNPEVNWLELEFRSERDVPIEELKVTITNPATQQTHQKTTSQGNVTFSPIAAGEWVVSVDTDNLLSEVEQYASRKKEESSPVMDRAGREVAEAHGNVKEYYAVNIGDLWQEEPDDEFLVEYHAPVMKSYRQEVKGFRGSHNRTLVFEIKALRSYMPMIIDTDEFSLVNSYTFALLSKLAYATDKTNLDDGKSLGTNGSIDNVITRLKRWQIPNQTSNLLAKWLVKEVPYSHALEYEYYADSDSGAEGYILFNQEIAIIGVRGTEPYFEDRDREERGQLWKIVKTASGLEAVVMEKIHSFANSPGAQDLIETDLDAAQIAPSEFNGTYVHRGFYRYSLSLWNQLDEVILKKHARKRFYVCGHSLGGAGALLISAFIHDTYAPTTLRLFTYGMPRTGTRSFVQCYRGILHYRHVNNHDLVPQVPMTWLNTDISEGFDISDVFSSGVALAKKMVTDDDDDNYLHHGELTQLISYSGAQQVLLSPRQTQITMLDIVKMAENDSIALVGGLSNASVSDHGMEFYVPNLWNQLYALNKETLEQNYQGAINYLDTAISELQTSYSTVHHEWVKTLGTAYSPILEAQKMAIQKEKSVLEEQIHNYQKVLSELKILVTNPKRMPLKSSLLANTPLSEEIKEQIQ